MLLLLAIPNPITLLVTLLIIGIVIALGYLIINRLFPEPVRTWAWIILLVIVAIYAIMYVLMPMARGGSQPL